MVRPASAHDEAVRVRSSDAQKKVPKEYRKPRGPSRHAVEILLGHAGILGTVKPAYAGRL